MDNGLALVFYYKDMSMDTYHTMLQSYWLEGLAPQCGWKPLTSPSGYECNAWNLKTALWLFNCPQHKLIQEDLAREMIPTEWSSDEEGFISSDSEAPDQDP